MTKSVCLLAVLMMATPAMADVFDYAQSYKFDSYTATGDPQYPIDWPTTPGKSRIPLGNKKVYSTPWDLEIKKQVDAGIQRDMTPDLVAHPHPGGMTHLRGTANNPIMVQFVMWGNKVSGSTLAGFTELTLDMDVCPDLSGTAADGLAFGFLGGTDLMVFDGLNWVDSGLDFRTDLKWNTTRLHVYDTHVVAESNGVLSDQILREYEGDFNSVGVRNPGNDGTWRTIDDLWVTDGQLVPEPATLALLALGLPWLVLLLRRRARRAGRV